MNDNLDLSAESELNEIDASARDTYQNLRKNGLSDTDIMAFAGELLSLVASEVRSHAAAE